jgi:hypothetical protein
MLKQMLLGLGAASLLVVVTAMPVQAVPLAGPLPESVIVTRGAWEWVWVSPCAEEAIGESCSFGTEHYGFAAPDNDTQWIDSFTGYPDLLNAFTDPNNGVPILRCATPYFSQDYTDCHDGDLVMGAVRQAPYLPHPTGTDLRGIFGAEVFWVRASTPSPLPEPSSLLLLGAGLLGLAAWRWKHRA